LACSEFKKPFLWSMWTVILIPGQHFHLEQEKSIAKLFKICFCRNMHNL